MLISINRRGGGIETSSFCGKIAKKLFKEIKALGDSDKKDEFRQERMFGV